MNKNLTIGEFFKLCLANKAKFAASVALMLVLAAAYLIVTPPKYTRKAQLLVRDEGGMGGLMGQLGGLAEIGGIMGVGFGSSNVYNELYAMQSPWLLLNVVNQMHLDMSYTIKGIRNKDLYGEQLPVTVTFKNITDEDDVRMKLDLNKNGNFKLYKIKKNDDKYDDELTGKVNSTLKTSIGDVEIKATPYLQNMKDDEVTITVKRTEPMALVEQIKKKQMTIAVSSRDASIIDLKYKDVSKQRATDVINAMRSVYNLGNYVNNGVTHVEDFINGGSETQSSSSVVVSSSSVAVSSSSEITQSSSSVTIALPTVLAGAQVKLHRDGNTIYASDDILLFDMNGNLVRSTNNVSAGQAQMQLHGLRQGNYIAKCQNSILQVRVR